MKQHKHLFNVASLGTAWGGQHEDKPVQFCTISTAGYLDEVYSSSHGTSPPENAEGMSVNTGQQQTPILLPILLFGYLKALPIPSNSKSSSYSLLYSGKDFCLCTRARFALI